MVHTLYTCTVLVTADMIIKLKNFFSSQEISHSDNDVGDILICRVCWIITASWVASSTDTSGTSERRCFEDWVIKGAVPFRSGHQRGGAFKVGSTVKSKAKPSITQRWQSDCNCLLPFNSISPHPPNAPQTTGSGGYMGQVDPLFFHPSW